MSTVTLQEAEAGFSSFIEAIESGAEAEIVITRDGTPVARLVPMTKPDVGKRLGLLQGKYPDMSLEEFNSTDGEILKLFYGEEGAAFFKRDR